MSTIQNLFVEQEEAKRYNQYRPVYHHLPAAKLLEFFGKKIPRTLDVACGTGHSTKALAEISDVVVGCDLSESMLSEARKNAGLDFIQSKAEDLPFPAAEFDYVNISMAYQWLDQVLFLKEAHRVLRAGGRLGVDNYGFTGKMSGSDSFVEKYRDFDRKNMRSVVRHKDYPDVQELADANFQLEVEIAYDHMVPMNKKQFVNYLMTRSNYLNLSSEQRSETKAKLENYYDDDFGSEKQEMHFRGLLKLYRAIY